jgi:hypothetical protein
MVRSIATSVVGVAITTRLLKAYSWSIESCSMAAW